MTDLDDILFAATDYPDEPLTTGVPFGPGSNFVRQGQENDRDFLSRMAVQVATARNATPRVRSFATRVARGE